jgi:hypothetical protein
VRLTLVVASISLALLTAACADQSPTGPGLPGSANTSSTAVADNCAVIDFASFAHGDRVAQVGALGLTLSVSATQYLHTGVIRGPLSPRAFNTDISDDPNWEDDDLRTAGECPGCAPLDIMLVIPDSKGFTTVEDPAVGALGDHPYGGTIRLAGFTGGEYYVNSFAAVDVDNAKNGFAGIGTRLFYDASPDAVAVSGQTGNGGVATVPVAGSRTFTSSITFELGTSAQDYVTGSGGIDDILVCRVVETPPPPPPTNPGTGTIGYWKNHADAWPVTSIVIGGVTYSRDAAIAVMNTSGKGDKTYDLFVQLVAAKLNVGIGNEDDCIAADIAAADAWLVAHPLGSQVGGGTAAWAEISSTHTRLDDYNNGKLCAPHRG